MSSSARAHAPVATPGLRWPACVVPRDAAITLASVPSGGRTPLIVPLVFTCDPTVMPSDLRVVVGERARARARGTLRLALPTAGAPRAQLQRLSRPRATRAPRRPSFCSPCASCAGSCRRSRRTRSNSRWTRTGRRRRSRSCLRTCSRSRACRRTSPRASRRRREMCSRSRAWRLGGEGGCL